MPSLLDVVNPYMLYVKIGAVVLLVAGIAGSCWYVRSVFSERNSLLEERGRLSTQLIIETKKTEVAMEQVKQWQTLVERMNQSLKAIKVEANTYVTNAETGAAPVMSPGVTVPLILSGVSASSTVPRFAPVSSGRAGTVTAPR